MATLTAGETLTDQQTLSHARSAGFSGSGLVVICAIAKAESGLNTHAINSSDPYGGSFGILQINGAHFGDKFGPNGMYTMSENAAFQPGLAFLFSWELSKYGKDFHDWGTYTSGAYLQFLPEMKAAANGPVGIASQFPPYTGTPWYDYDMYSDFPSTSYRNTDVRTPTDTPITAPLAGTITALGYFDWGGQVTMQVDNPSAIGGHKYDFVIHLDAINPNLNVGDHVNQGEFLGYSGGQLSDNNLKPLPDGLQHHVTLPSHSTGPHLDIGVTDDPQGSMDVDQGASNALVLIARQLRIGFGTNDAGMSSGGIPPDSSSPPPGTPGNPLLLGNQTLGQEVHNTLVQYPGFYGIAAAVDEAEHFPGFRNEIPPGENFVTNGGDIIGGALQSITDAIINNTIPIFVRGFLILLGMFLVLALLWQLTKPNIEALPQVLGMVGAFA